MHASNGRRSDSADEVARAIVHYLREHPHAADTAEGITRWWLGSMLDAVPADALDQALAALVASRHLLRDSPGDGRYVYRRGPNIDAEITRRS